MNKTCDIAFLDVGNADCTVILPSNAPAVIIDIPQPDDLAVWLEQNQQTEIDAIYITHEHKDHTPTLARLVRFVGDWRENKVLKALCLPNEMIARAIAAAEDPSVSDNLRLDLTHAIGQLDAWRESGRFKVIVSEGTLTPDRLGDLELAVLHPDLMFRQRSIQKHPDELNERSMVLRVSYGKFRALLTADLEGRGLEDLLARCNGADLKCQVLKIPHHGAWQRDEASFRELLSRSDPELAVLSVGSRNTYGHVAPELFRELLSLQHDEGAALQTFVCTEVTRTCVFLEGERRRMGEHGRGGLSEKFPCMGDVIVQGDYSGTWTLRRRSEHIAHINSVVQRPACFGKADLKSSPRKVKPASKRVRKKISGP